MMKELMRAAANRRLRAAAAAILIVAAAGSCNLTPGVPIPPPPRENFTISDAREDCRGITVVLVDAVPGTFEAGELALFTNIYSRWGVVAPVEDDGSLYQIEVPVADGEAFSIRRRTVEGDESLPISCMVPASGGQCWEPVP
jgi:hypothetical protein